MKSRPRRLTGLSLLLFGIALGFPAQVCWMFEEPPWALGLIATQMAPLNWVVFFLCLLAGVQAWQATPALRHTLPWLVGLLVYNNALVAAAGLNASTSAAGIGATAFGGALAFCLNHEVRQILAHPELRWWRTPLRHRLAAPIRLQGLPATTFDLSRTGAFVRAAYPLPFAAGARIPVLLPIRETGRFLRLAARVVRSAEKTEQRPAGIGIQFEAMTWGDQWRLARFLRDHHPYSATQLAA